MARYHVMSRRTRTWRAVDWVALSAILLIAGALRLAGVATPSTLSYDEYHYARQACFQAGDASVCGFRDERRAFHPPLARSLIAVGIRVFGNTPFGWRVASVLAGTLTVALLYVLARRLLESTAAAVVASGLLAIDVLHFIHSRLALLDVFVGLFVVAAALCCLYDRERILHDPTHVGGGALCGLRDHPWRVAAGVVAGAAAASKWPGAFILPALVLLTVGWEMSVRSDRGLKAAAVGVLREETLSLAVAFLLMPVLVYAVSHAWTIDGTLLAWPWSARSWVRLFVHDQVFLYRLHAALTRQHPFQAPPWLWFSPTRAVVYYSRFDVSGYRIIASIGNPFAWWPALLALGYLAARWLRDRRPVLAEVFILAGLVATYGPWFLLTGDRKPFQFYLLPAIPFMELALASVVVVLARRRVARALIPIWAVLTVAFFVSAYPWFTAAKEPDRWWLHLSPKSVECETLTFMVPAPSREQLRC